MLLTDWKYDRGVSSLADRHPANLFQTVSDLTTGKDWRRMYLQGGISPENVFFDLSHQGFHARCKQSCTASASFPLRPRKRAEQSLALTGPVLCENSPTHTYIWNASLTVKTSCFIFHLVTGTDSSLRQRGLGETNQFLQTSAKRVVWVQYIGLLYGGLSILQCFHGPQTSL